MQRGTRRFPVMQNRRTRSRKPTASSARIYTAKVIPSLGKINWHSFLDRPPLSPVLSEAIAAVSQCSVLITGAGGSIGAALATQLASHATKLVLLESSESSLFDLQCAFKSLEPRSQPAFFLGSASDRELLNEICAVHAPRLVFHAAAFKHVPLLEEQPLAAIANNVFSTASVVSVAAAQEMRVILLSTDKAVAPASVMGATKRVAEQIVLTSGGVILRLGNVLASSGSVTEIFARQIAAGMPLTVTDPAARRYFLTISEAVDLLLAASAYPRGPALFVPSLRKMHFVADLARFMAGALAIPIEFISLRAGDKETEELWSAGEVLQATEIKELLRGGSPMLPSGRLRNLLNSLSSAVESRDVSAAISTLREMVPDYTPGATVLTARSLAEPPVHHE